MKPGRIGHLAINTDIFLRTTGFDSNNVRHYLVCPSDNNEIANLQLLRMFKRVATVIRSDFLYILIWKYRFFFSKTGLISWMPITSTETHVFANYPSVLSFISCEKYKGHKLLLDMGIDINKEWYVCVFARDPKYLAKFKKNEYVQDFSYHDCRDTDIDTFIPAIKYVISLGGYVIRIGNSPEKSVNFSSPKFIDYPYTEYLLDFMDIFLIGNARYIIGTTSGIGDVASVFNVPRLGVNVVPFGSVNTGVRNMSIHKRIQDQNGVDVSYYHQNVLPYNFEFNCHKFGGKSSEYHYIDNTEDEILEAVKDFSSYLNNFKISNKEDCILLKRYEHEYWVKMDHSYANPRTSISWLRKYQHLYFRDIDTGVDN
jgi:putative glycosyltransferase (TIGR04372 family)